MTCRAPLEAAQHKIKQGKPIVYKKGRRPKTLAEGYRALELPCGQCKSCKLEKSRQWAARMMHEAAYWEEFKNKSSLFLTLTYNDEHLPMYGTLVKEHIQEFFKRLRWHIGRDKLRYYVVGEYGSQCPDHEIINCPVCGPLQRPHYHAIIFGWTPGQKEVLGHRDGATVYASEIIEKAWTKRNQAGKKTVIGGHEWGSCTFESCAYVSRYIMKKINGNDEAMAEHYCKYIPLLDTWVDLPPEFSMMSKRPGIGKKWYDHFQNDIYPTDEMPIPGRTNISKPAKYYDGFYEKSNPEQMAAIKEDRRKAMADSLVNGPSLESRAKCEDARLKQLTRTL